MEFSYEKVKFRASLGLKKESDMDEACLSCPQIKNIEAEEPKKSAKPDGL